MRRRPLGWAAALLLTGGLWWLLLAGVLGSPHGVGLLFAGGWTLSLLPIHSTRRLARARSAPQPEPLGGGVEPGGLEGGTEL
ncbi:hypothetical protein GXW83_26760 [Streptacidiphilus sp. PB12-B1b]|uniref:hypothetical protein n=1 Tax=Streptacidiphilus sp. PB12-B1b TaxID=2705012 RepID=UPI0015FE5729|nr:hypothetical protein [Streptacidiphilus sp. PB12-B1b]QMU74412.1 hypothetical protein GXW83_26760 [Streptacidiphilus sp. PB12-B1b]